MTTNNDKQQQQQPSFFLSFFSLSRMSLPGSVQNQQLETVRLRIFRSEEKKEFLKKNPTKTWWYLLVPTRTSAIRVALARTKKKTRRWLSKNKAHYSLYEETIFCSVPGQSSMWPKFPRPGRWGGSARDSSPRGTPPARIMASSSIPWKRASPCAIIPDGLPMC